MSESCLYVIGRCCRPGGGSGGVGAGVGSGSGGVGSGDGGDGGGGGRKRFTKLIFKYLRPALKSYKLNLTS